MQTVTLPLHCPYCGGPIELACESTETVDEQTIRFDCPYCGRVREFSAPGRVLWVAMRMPQEGPETRH